MNNNFKGKKVIVTGGTRGIGRAVSCYFEKFGAEVIVTGTKNNKTFDKNRFYSVDFANDNEVYDFSRVISKLDPDILVNNAGINIIEFFREISLDNYNKVHKVNVAAPFQFCQAAIDGMKSRGWGRIVNISSIWGLISKAGRASYSMSKFALDGMTAALAAEVASEGILVNCVSPGFVETEMTRNNLSENEIQDLCKQIPIRRLAKPEEIAKFIIWLASSENTYISGQNLVIDGGFTRV